MTKPARSHHLWQRWKKVLAIAWPLIIANSFWNLQMTIDRVFLGQWSTEALGAAMAVMGVFWTPMALLQQTVGYVTTFVAQYFGADEPEMIGPAIWQSIYVALGGGVLFIGLIWFSVPLFAMMDHSAGIQAHEVAYFDAMTLSALPMALVAAASGYFTGLGKTVVVMWINGAGLVVNAFFDYLLIFGNWGFPELGITGAGYATTIANWAGAILGFALILRDCDVAKYRLLSGWRWNTELLRRFLKYGFPSGLQWALEGLAFTVFLLIMGRLSNGDAALASSSIAVTVMMLAVLPALGVGQAVMVLVGQHLGEKRPDLAEEDSWSGVQMAISYIVAVGCTFLLFPDFYVGWFENQDDPNLWQQVSQITPYLLMFVALFTTFDSLNLVLSSGLKGAGDTRFVSLVALFMPWPLMVAPTILMQDWPGAVYWGWGAASIYIICMALVFLRRFQGGRWKSMSVIHSEVGS